MSNNFRISHSRYTTSHSLSIPSASKLRSFPTIAFSVTYRRPVWIYPLKVGDRRYPELPELREFFSEQFHVNYKERARATREDDAGLAIQS